MCGIVGYTGPRDTSGVIMDGLGRLEYRGYDSAGIALADGSGGFTVVRRVGKLANLADQLRSHPVSGRAGIGHTRWATHGRPSETNAHPHTERFVSVVHNGIIENYLELRRAMEAAGDRFDSETDTEIFAHLLARNTDTCAGSLLDGLKKTVREVHGAFAVVVLDARSPETLYVARKSSPLIVGRGEGENFVASDIPALLPYTRDMVSLGDGELGVLTPDGVRLMDFAGAPVERAPRRIDWSPVMAEKGGYRHFMEKEIHEQPAAVIDTLRGRMALARHDIDLGEGGPDAALLAGTRRIVILACGTSYHAGLVGRFVFERFSGLPVDVDLASEFRYREVTIGPGTLVVAVSQSGETADTLAAVEAARRAGATVLAVCNVVDSSIPRAADRVVYTHAGPEISVASTKAFTTQLAVFYLLGLKLGIAYGRLTPGATARCMDELLRVPELMEQVLEQGEKVREVAGRFLHARHFLFLGRNLNYPIALEGALKLKEISYIHAEGYPAGEMKHGPIALIDEEMPVLVIATRNPVYPKVLGNVQEVLARKGRLVALVTRGDRELASSAADLIEVPPVDPLFEPLLTVLPTQLLAYHMAVLKGTDVDQPRNLAKSVTVE